MTTDTWNVNSDGDWSTATDWSDGVPQAGDSVVISTTQLHTITYDSASPSVSVASLTVGDDNFVVDGSGTLAITTSASFGALLEVEAGAINFNSVSATIASFEQTGGTIGGAGTLTVSGAATFGGSSYDEAEGAGTTLLDGVTTDTGTIALDGGYVLANAGTFDVTSSASFYLGYGPYTGSVGNGTIQNNSGGTFDFQTASTVYNESGTNAFVNAGTLEQTVTTGTTDIEVAVTNTGTVSVQTGTLEFSGGGTSTAGKFTVASGATLDFGAGTFTLSGGSYDATGTTEVSGSGTANFSGATITSLGALDVTGGTLSIANSGTATSLAQTGGTIGGAGTLTVSGAATFGGSSYDEAEGAGTTLLDGVTTDTGTIALDGGYVLANAGTFDVTSSASFYLGYGPYTGSVGNGTIQNNSGGTFDFQTASTVYNESGTNAFVNAGTLEQTVTTGTTDIEVAVTNTGTVSVQTGTLEFSGGGTSTAGKFTVASGATLDFGAGTFTLSGGSYDATGTTEVSGSGTANFSGATITSLGALDVTGGTLSIANSGTATSLAQTGGTIGGAGTLTVSGAATFGGSSYDEAEGAGTTLLDGVTTDTGTIALDGGYVLANAGTFDVTSSASFYLGYGPYTGSVGNGTIQNNSGGTFDFQTASTVYNESGTNAFVNAGTLEQTVTTGTTDIEVAVTNTGTVSVQTGTLEFSGGGTSTAGKFTVASGATLDFASGTFTLSGGSYDATGTTEVSGSGTANFSGATITSLGALDITGGTLALGSNSGAAASLEQTGGTVEGTGTLTVSGAATFGGSSYDAQTGTGTTLLDGTTTDSGTITLDGGYVLANAGTFDVTSSASFILGYYPYGSTVGGGTIKNEAGGTFDFQTAATVNNESGTNAFVNAGTLEQTVTTGTTDIDVTFTNTGTVSVQTGTLEFTVGGSSSDGTYILASGAALNFGDGTFTLSGDSFSGAGVAQLSAGTLAISANSTIGSGFTQTGGTITGPATLTVSGAATFGGSSYDEAEGAGTTLLDGVTTDTGTIALDGGYVLANAGTFDVTSSASFYLGYGPYTGSVGNGTIQNNSGGTFDFQTASTVYNESGTNAFVNAGTLEQTVTTGTTDIEVAVTNTGAVSVKTGTLEFSAGTASTAGTFTVASGATLDFDAGAFTLSGGSIGGAGTLLLAGGSTTLKSGAKVSMADFSETGSGTSLTVSEALAYAETFSQSAGSTTAISKGDSLSLTGTASLSGTTSGAGTLNLAGGSATIDKGAKLSVSNWSISGAGTDVTLGENLTYAHSFSEGAGDTLVLSGGHLLLTGADTFAGGTVDGSKLLETKGTTTVSGLTIGGTVEWENTTSVTQSGTVTIGDASGHKAFLDNTSTGIYDITANSGINQGSSTASYIENAGLFEETGGTSTSTIAPAVTNTGTIEVTAATLDFKGAVTGTGTDTISGASTLEFDSGVSSSTTVGSQNIGFTGGGTLDLTDPTSFYGEVSSFAAGDTVELLGSWAFSGFSENSGGTLATLTLMNGTTTHAFDFVGDYTQGDFKITSGATSTITHT